VNGVASGCVNGAPGPWSGKKVICGEEVSGDSVWSSVTCVREGSNFWDDLFANDGRGGKYGGTCRCPNGDVYSVGNDPSKALKDEALMCKDGIKATFVGDYGVHSFKSVVCEPAGSLGKDQYSSYDFPGRLGGFCKCPNGQVYPAGDRWDNCGSLTCDGGEPIERALIGQSKQTCFRFENEMWAQRGVQCWGPK
jgi:hypothetical protein